MQLTKVQSTMIYAVGYDTPCERLEVVYFNGVYRELADGWEERASSR